MLDGAGAPDLDDVRALARSSPWRWTSLLLVPPEAGRGWSGLGGYEQQRPRRPLEPSAPQPDMRGDGLVARRPWGWEVDDDDPLSGSCRWVAMLDPVELADGSPPFTGETGADDRDSALSPLEAVRPVAVVEHEGRAACSPGQRYLAGDPAYESSTGADCRATGPVAADVDVTRCGPMVDGGSLQVSVNAESSRSFTSDDVVLVHALDAEGRLVGEAMGSIRYVRSIEERLEILSVTPDGPVAGCVLAKVVRL